MPSFVSTLVGPAGAPRPAALHARLDRLDQPALRLGAGRLRPAPDHAGLALLRAGADPRRRACSSLGLRTMRQRRARQPVAAARSAGSSLKAAVADRRRWRSSSATSTSAAACRGCSASSSLLVVVMNYAFTRTKWGRSMMAVGGNAEAARRAGINVRRIYISAFMLCSMFAALGGMLSAVAPRLGQPAGRHRRRQPQRHRRGGDRRHQPLRRARQRLVGAARDHRDPVDLQRADAAEPVARRCAT